jgi:hypothetical protein
MVGGGGGFTVSVSVAVPVPPAFVAEMATLETPSDVGVPEMIPFEAFTENPAGNPVAPKLVGPFVAVIW